MKEPLVTVEQSQRIRVAADQLWPLLSGPQAWSALQNRFAFDVTVPPGTRLRVVLGLNGARPFAATYVLEDGAPGLAMSMRAGASSDPEQVITVSAVPDGDGAVATIAIRARGKRASAGRDRWLASWLAALSEAAGWQIPNRGPGMPESLRVRCAPGTPLRKPLTASASALIAAPPDTVWNVVYAPESSVMTAAEVVAAGVVPGTPAGQAGELQYFVHRGAGGLFTTSVLAVTDLDPGRSARTAGMAFPHMETWHQISPQAQGTRLELTICWPGSLPGGKNEAFARAMAEAAQRAADGYRDLIENRGNPQP